MSNDVTWHYMKRRDELPPLTALQFLILGSIGGGKMRGAEVRERLKENGVHKSGPAFYQVMARLEEAKMVDGWYEQEVVAGQIIKQRWYRVTGQGERAHRRTLEFYRKFNTLRPAYA